MGATNRKCVFYNIFKNTTKHQKIFFKTFFKMQPNTWKYFHFPKIFSPKNVLHLKNILHWNKCSLREIISNSNKPFAKPASCEKSLNFAWKPKWTPKVCVKIKLTFYGTHISSRENYTSIFYCCEIKGNS